MHKKLIINQGYTIAEILITLVIIGVIATIIITSAKPYNSAMKKLYSRAYDILSEASYNYAVDTEANTIDSANNLCVGLSKYINSNAATSPKTGENFKGNPDTGYCNNITTRVTQYTQDFKNLTPDFIANNGMRFFISEQITTPEITDSDGLTNKIRFYIVFVDLDGEKGAGKIIPANKNTVTDIASFAVTDSADVLPLGFPVINKTYLTARIEYPEDKIHQNEKYSKSLTYYDAFHKAWGGLTTFEDLRTFDYNTFINASSAIKKDLTYPDAPAKDSLCSEFDCDVKIQRYF
jgi:prepilin-type N-terminal cleavage/methylation domain-containing protein